jgi:hypothetical protein
MWALIPRLFITFQKMRWLSQLFKIEVRNKWINLLFCMFDKKKIMQILSIPGFSAMIRVN